MQENERTARTYVCMFTSGKRSSYKSNSNEVMTRLLHLLLCYTHGLKVQLRRRVFDFAYKRSTSTPLFLPVTAFWLLAIYGMHLSRVAMLHTYAVSFSKTQIFIFDPIHRRFLIHRCTNADRTIEEALTPHRSRHRIAIRHYSLWG